MSQIKQNYTKSYPNNGSLKVNRFQVLTRLWDGNCKKKCGEEAHRYESTTSAALQHTKPDFLLLLALVLGKVLSMKNSQEKPEQNLVRLVIVGGYSHPVVSIQ